MGMGSQLNLRWEGKEISAAGDAGNFGQKSSLKVVDDTHRTLPRKILRLRENSLSLFVSNLPEEMSNVEFEAMFCWVGKTLYSFIPIDESNGKKRGFGFIRFGSFNEAEKGMELARGRSWGGRKIKVQEKRGGA